MNYSEKAKKSIIKSIVDELERSFDVNKFGKGTPFWMSLLFLIKRFNRGNYYGTLEFKILGTSCNDVKEKERTFKLMEVFEDPK
jgi:hypothetical protein